MSLLRFPLTVLIINMTVKQTQWPKLNEVPKVLYCGNIFERYRLTVCYILGPHEGTTYSLAEEVYLIVCHDMAHDRDTKKIVNEYEHL